MTLTAYWCDGGREVEPESPTRRQPPGAEDVNITGDIDVRAPTNAAQRTIKSSKRENTTVADSNSARRHVPTRTACAATEADDGN